MTAGSRRGEHIKGHENREGDARKDTATQTWPPVHGEVRISKGTRTGKVTPVVIPVMETWPPIVTEVWEPAWGDHERVWEPGRYEKN